MTTIAQAREAIYQAFVDAWAGVTPIALDNEAFEPTPDVAWVRLVVRHTAGFQSTLGRTGNRKFASIGAAVVQISTKKNDGTAEADTLAKTAKDAFEGKSIAGTTIFFKDVNVRETAPSPDDDWYQVIVDAAFEYDETK